MGKARQQSTAHRVEQTPSIQPPVLAEVEVEGGWTPEDVLATGMGQSAARAALPPPDDNDDSILNPIDPELNGYFQQEQSIAQAEAKPPSKARKQAVFAPHRVATELRTLYLRETDFTYEHVHARIADQKRAQALVSGMTPQQYDEVATSYAMQYGADLDGDLAAFDNAILDAASQARTLEQTDLSQRVLANAGVLNSNEGGMLAAVQSASMNPAQRQAAANDPEVMAAMRAAMSPAELYQAQKALATTTGSSEDEADANTHYRAVVERIGSAKGTWLPTSWDDLWNIGNRSTFLNDDEQSIYDALLDLPMEQRKQLYAAEGDLLKSIFNEAEMQDVALLCGLGDEEGSEVEAVETRMRLATQGMGTDEIGVNRAVQDAQRLLGEQAQLKVMQQGLQAQDRTEGSETDDAMRSHLSKRMTALEGAQRLTDKDGDFHKDMVGDLSEDVVDGHHKRLTGQAEESPSEGPQPGELETPTGRRKVADRLRQRVHKRLAQKAGIGRSFTNTDETAIQVAAEFELAYKNAVADEAVSLPELLLLQAHYDDFERRFADYEQTIDGISAVAATVAGVTAGLVIGALCPAVLPTIPAILSGAGCGAAATLFAGAAIQGEQLTAEEAAGLLLSGAVQGGLAVGGQVLAAGLTKAANGGKLGTLAMTAAKAGSNGRALPTIAFESLAGSLEGALGDAVLTAADIQVWQGMTWSKMGQIAGAMARGGLIGGLTGGGVSGAGAGVRQLRRGADELPVHAVDDAVEGTTPTVDTPEGEGNLQPWWSKPLEEPAVRKAPSIPEDVADPARVAPLVGITVTREGFEAAKAQAYALGYVLKMDADGFPSIKRRPNWGKAGAPPLYVDVVTNQIARGYKRGGSNRISKPGRLRDNLMEALGDEENWSGHQAHHLIPDEVIRNSQWLKMAYDKGWFDIDDIDNGLMMATKEDGKMAYSHPKYGRIQGDGADLPMHRTAHPEFNAKAERMALKIEEQITDAFGSAASAPEEAIQEAIEDLQEGLFDFIQTPKAKIPTGQDRAGHLAQVKGETDVGFA